MDNSTIQKIQQILNDLIGRNGRVFWYDEGEQMQLIVTVEQPGHSLRMEQQVPKTKQLTTYKRGIL